MAVEKIKTSCSQLYLTPDAAEYDDADDDDDVVVEEDVGVINTIPTKFTKTGKDHKTWFTFYC